MTISEEFNNEFIQITDREVLNILKELNAYHNVRKKYHILNCQKLMELLRLYCSFLLDERSHIRGKSTMILEGTWYQLDFRGHDSEGNSREVSISEGFKGFIEFVSIDLVNSLDIACFKSLIKLFTAVIQHPGINIEDKYIILNAENGLLRSTYEFYIWDLSESEIRYFLSIRKDYIFERIKIGKKNTEHLDIDDVELLSLYDTYKYYVSWLIKSHIRTNKFSDIFELLDDELRKCTDPILGTFLLWSAITYNNLFLIRNKSVIQQEVVDYSHLIQEDKRQFIDEALDFSLTDIDLKDQTIELVVDNLASIDLGKTKTVIYATIPLKLVAESPWSMVIDNISITLRSIKNPIEDPIHNFLYNLGWCIGGIPLTFLSDVLQDPENSTLMIASLDSFFHPDFEIVNGQIVKTDFGEIEAIWARKYYPHKEKIVVLLRKLYELAPDEFPFGISKSQINIDLISNYLVNYTNESGRSFFHKLYTITNPDSFPKIKTKYLERVSELNLENDFLGVRNLKLDSHIVSSSSLRDFTYKAIEIIVKKAIELRGVYKYLWADKEMSKPLSEKDVQPLIKSHLQPILEENGIQISREVVAANGSIDYLCSYTKDDRLFKVGIELKNAHYGDLAHGLASQLPAYLQDEGTPDGIFLVLWYKNTNHPYPGKYKTPKELSDDLQKVNPSKYRIQVMVIDCTRNPSPSNL